MLIRHIFRACKSVAFLCRIWFQRPFENPDAVLIIYNKLHPLYWLASDPGLKDRIVHDTLVEQGYTVNVLVNPSAADLLAQSSGALVWFNPHHFIFSVERRAENYKNSLHELVRLLDGHFARCIPSHADIQFWENKGYMYKQLALLGVSHPNTKFIENSSDYDWDGETYPLIIKTEDGYSSNGLWLCRSPADLPFGLISASAPAIVQEFLNITFDIRVICVAGCVVSFYWRMNSPSDEWRPTATQNGATVKFNDLPRSVENLARSIYAQTGCLTYGADICFRNDDLTTEPFVLEFSPIYQPNPTPPKGLVTQNYSSFKKGSVFAYDSAFEALNRYITYMIVLEDRITMKQK